MREWGSSVDCMHIWQGGGPYDTYFEPRHGLGTVYARDIFKTPERCLQNPDDEGLMLLSQ